MPAAQSHGLVSGVHEKAGSRGTVAGVLGDGLRLSSEWS